MPPAWPASGSRTVPPTWSRSCAARPRRPSHPHRTARCRERSPGTRTGHDRWQWRAPRTATGPRRPGAPPPKPLHGARSFRTPMRDRDSRRRGFLLADQLARPIAAVARLVPIIVQRARDPAVQEAGHVHAVGDGELLPVLAANAAAAVVRPAGAIERFVEIHDEAAVVDEDFFTFADRPRRHDVPIDVVAQVRIAGMIDEVVGGGDVSDVHRADDLVEVLIEAITQEQLLYVPRKLAHLAPVQPDPALHAFVKGFV